MRRHYNNNLFYLDSMRSKIRAPSPGVSYKLFLLLVLGVKLFLGVSALRNNVRLSNNNNNMNKRISLSSPRNQLRYERNSNNNRIHMSMSTSVPHTPSNIAVSLTRPLIDPSAYKSRNIAAKFVEKLLIPIFCCDNVRYHVALTTFLLAFLLSVLSRYGVRILSAPSILKQLARSGRDVSSRIFGGINLICNLAKGKIIRVTDRLQQLVKSTLSDPGVPMPFNDAEGDGWGKCTLRSKKTLGKKGSFVQFDFDLPQKDFVLPLQLGQKLSLCCLDENDNIAKGDFYLFNPRTTKGYFSILAPYGNIEKVSSLLGPDNANFASVLENHLNVGDEVALRPGPKALNYNGQYWPVTDMVFLVYGSGVVPILDQIKSILPSYSSTSVRSASVTWVNNDYDAFDLAVTELENEFYKYNKKLDVSCCLATLLSTDRRLEDYADIEQSIPNFQPGTMAVISGPTEFSDKASAYLQSNRNYPMDCICILPP